MLAERLLYNLTISLYHYITISLYHYITISLYIYIPICLYYNIFKGTIIRNASRNFIRRRFLVWITIFYVISLYCSYLYIWKLICHSSSLVSKIGYLAIGKVKI